MTARRLRNRWRRQPNHGTWFAQQAPTKRGGAHMSWKKIAAAGAIAGSLGVATMGLGSGMASADPGGGHGGPPCFYCQDQRGHDNGRDDRGPQRYADYDRWDQRGID